MAETPGAPISAGLLLLRIGTGGLMIALHGWSKLTSFSERSATFPDPLGVGSALSLTLTVFAEVFCSIAIVAGFLTRASSAILLITMLVAAFLQHAPDPWSTKEKALLYAVPFLTLIFTGGGAFSLDQVLDPVYRKLLRK